MKKQLEAIKTKLEGFLDEAEDKEGSENEKTAEKYGDVVPALTAAIEAVEEAIAALDQE